MIRHVVALGLGLVLAGGACAPPCPTPAVTPKTASATPSAASSAMPSATPSATASATPKPEGAGEGVPHKTYPKQDKAKSYVVDASWPRERIPGDVWKEMSSIAVGPDGNVWTFNRGENPIQVYTPDGKLVAHWGHDVFRKPHTLRFDREGYLWASDTGTQTVRKFSTDGRVLLTLGTPDVPGSDLTHLNQPTDQAFGPNGEIFVTDGYGNDRVIVFDKNGKALRTWGKLGQGPGEFSLPHSIVIDSKRRVYVADRNNSRIQIFDLEGKFLSEWSNMLTPWFLLLDKHDALYACGSSPMLWAEAGGRREMLSIPPKDQIFLKLDGEGRLLQLWTLPKGADHAERPGELNWLHTMAFGTDGSLYAGDIRGSRAQKFRRAGFHADVDEN